MSEGSSTTDLRRRVEDLRAMVDELEAEARAAAAEYAEATNQAVHDYPATAVGVAFAAGLAAGVLIGWQGRKRSLPSAVVAAKK